MHKLSMEPEHEELRFAFSEFCGKERRLLYFAA